jgi:hypothetical protein
VKNLPGTLDFLTVHAVDLEGSGEKRHYYLGILNRIYKLDLEEIKKRREKERKERLEKMKNMSFWEKFLYFLLE